MKKNIIKTNIINFKEKSFELATPLEISQALAQKLREQRLLKNMKQLDLAKASGVSLGTVKNFEAKSQVSFKNLIRIICALGLSAELENLFKIEINSISMLEKIEKLKSKNLRKRAR
jgi:transcriptional regulator with XRE-family HTH domain